MFRVLACNIKLTVENKKAADVGDTKEAMVCIDNKYGFIELTNFNQISHNFRTFTQIHIM